MRSAVALLTRFPVATAETDAPGAAAFGLVGAFVGAAGAIPFAVLAGTIVQEPWLAAIACVAAMAVVTGGLHLDGLADTADALVARDPIGAERARKDPTLGVGGVLAILIVVTAQIAALASLAETIGPSTAAFVIVAVAATSRIVPVASTVAVGRLRARRDAALGSWFADRVTTADVLIAAGSAALITTGLAAVGGGIVVAGGLAVAIVGLVAAALIAMLRGGLDGDGMGALVELSMAAGLSTAAIVVV